VQQGDPLAPLLFSLSLYKAIQACTEVPGTMQLWFLTTAA